MTVFQNDGVQTCMPQNVSSLVLYYNRDLFEAAGIDRLRPGLEVERHGDGRDGAHPGHGR